MKTRCLLIQKGPHFSTGSKNAQIQCKTLETIALEAYRAALREFYTGLFTGLVERGNVPPFLRIWVGNCDPVERRGPKSPDARP